MLNLHLGSGLKIDQFSLTACSTYVVAEKEGGGVGDVSLAFFRGNFPPRILMTKPTESYSRPTIPSRPQLHL